MGLKDYYHRLRIFLTSLLRDKNVRPKIHKKKLQIQLGEAWDKFVLHLDKLEKFLEQQPHSSVKITGEQIYRRASSFKDQNLVKMNDERVQKIGRSLIHPADFSMWVLYEITSFTEEIYYYLHFATIGVSP